MPGRPKGVDKLGQLPPQSSSRKSRLNEFAKKRGPKPKLRLFGSSRVCLSVSYPFQNLFNSSVLIADV